VSLIAISKTKELLVVFHIRLFNCTYNIGLPCLFFHMYFLYNDGLSLTISSANSPSSIMCTSWSMSAWRKVPRISVTATCLPYLASIVHVSIIASRDTVGKLISALVVYSLCERPSAQPLAFMLPSRFSLRNIRFFS